MDRIGRKIKSIYDPETGRSWPISRLIEKLGVQALARKYRVTESTVRKWKRGIHTPSRHTLVKSEQQLF